MGELFKRIRGWGSLLALLALFVTRSLSAQTTTGTISGRITDKENQAPVAGVIIQAMTATGRTVGSAQTDADGQYRMTVPAGTYSLVITMVGYQAERVPTVRVVAGETSINGMALTTEAFALNPVVVSASKHAEKAIEAPAAVSVVPTREIAERPTTTPVEHLRNTPGVDIMTTGVQSTNVVARGFNNIFSGALHTLTDYRAANVPSLRVNFLQFLPQNNDDFSRIEVVLGPGAALYGPNTANGVLHFITKSPMDEQGTTLSVAGGTFGGAAPSSNAAPAVLGGSVSTKSGALFQATARTAQKLSETLGIKLSGQYFQAPEFFYRDRGEDSLKFIVDTASAATIAASPLFPATMSASERQARANKIGERDFDIKRWGVDARADWRPSEKLSTVLSAGLTNDNSIELTGIGAGQAVNWTYSYVQGRANYRNWFGQIYMNMSDAGDTYLLRNGAPITDQSKLWSAQLQHSASMWNDRQRFTYGGDYIHTNPVTNGTINGTRENTDNYSEVGGYLQSETELSKKFELVLAGRVDKHSELDKAVFSPRAGLVFKPTPDHSFRATYNKAFSTPTSLNLYLDIDAGPLGALGPFGFRAHAQAPGRAGINLHNSSGNLQIASPFNPAGPTALQDISLGSIYQNQVTAIAAAAKLPASAVTAMRNFQQDPTFASLSLRLLDPLTNKQTAFSNNAVSDIEGIKESTSQTFEVGYKGLVTDKLLFAADAWYAKHKNFTSPLIAATPLVKLDSASLYNFMVPRMTAVFTAGGLPPAVAAAQAQAVSASMTKLPGGVISSAAATSPGPNLLLTYINFGDLNLSGADVSLTALLSSKWQWSVTGSLVSDDYFNLPLGQGRTDSTVVALNAPKKKASTSLAYRDISSGLNAEARVRYQDEFPANSAGYVGLACVKGAPAGSGPCVKAFTLVDLTAGYRLPFTGASLQMSVTNLFDEKYQSFIGTPEIRRMAILRLRYDL